MYELCLRFHISFLRNSIPLCIRHSIDISSLPNQRQIPNQRYECHLGIPRIWHLSGLRTPIKWIGLLNAYGIEHA